MIPAAESADRVDQHRAAVDAAVEAGVPRIVYLSFVGAAPDATFTLARDHWETEEHIRAAGVRFTFLRMNLYMDFIASMVGADGVVRGPAGDGRLAAILRDDVAAAAAAVLPSGDHDGRTYDLTGREASRSAEAAGALSGRPARRSASRTRATRRRSPRVRPSARRSGRCAAGSARTRPSATAASRASALTSASSPAATRCTLAEHLACASGEPRARLRLARGLRLARRPCGVGGPL